MSTDPHVESPEFDISQGHGDTSLHQIFIDVYKHSIESAQKRWAKCSPIEEAFYKQYQAWNEHHESMVGQAVAEWKYRESFHKFRVLMWALSSMNEQLFELQVKDRVADLNEVDHSIETWWIIYDLGLEFQKDPSVVTYGRTM